MQNRMTMRTDRTSPFVRRRADGLAQIQSIALPSLSLGTLRAIRLGVIGVLLLVAALVVAPLWLAFGGRPAAPGRSGIGASQGTSLSGLGSHRR